MNRKIPGKLIACSDGRELDFLVKDYSVGGLGITSCDEILPDVDFLLKCADKEVGLSLVWGLDKNDGKGTHRYGFKLANQNDNLEEFLSEYFS